MNDFRMFCELLTKTMLKTIDFTKVLEIYRRNEQPKTLGIATSLSKFGIRNRDCVEKKSPR